MAEHSARLWTERGRQWRDPAAVVSQWPDAGVDKRLLAHRASSSFWELIDKLGVTILVSREYEHLVVALTTRDGRPHVTHLPLPHPSGVAVDLSRGLVHVAATRNPNQLLTFMPARHSIVRADADRPDLDDRPLVPVDARFLPGSLYLHDLVLVGGSLHGNAVGHNSIVKLGGRDGWKRVWWPKAIETSGGPDWSANYIQLNSIAAGRSLRDSFFSASSDAIATRRPGMRNYPVDGRGVIFSGRTREVVARGLTRPHSARLEPGSKRLWVDNSGYGEVGVIEQGRFEAMARLPGWTRGLAFCGHIAFVATSRVIPRFRAYAPGLDVDRSSCAIHALDIETGEIVGTLRWPHGNQVFAVEYAPRSMTLGFPFGARSVSTGTRARDLFYAFDTTYQED